MKLAIFALSILSMGLFLVNLTGCSTTSPGTSTDAMGDYSTNIDGTPDKVADAAKKSADDLKLMNVTEVPTAVDGTVTAKTADGRDVKISISPSGDKVSKVTIRVGTTGDAAVSQQLIDGIKHHMSWL
jgi:hypothetical protein